MTDPLTQLKELQEKLVRVTKPKPPISKYDPPRYLTKDEINQILNKLPLLISPIKEVGEHSRENLKTTMIQFLNKIKIAPIAIPELIQRIVMSFWRSKISPGEPVGMTAAEAVGMPASQQTLNAFHTAGTSRNLSKGIDSYRELLYTYKKKEPICSIYFNHDVTIDDVLINKRRELIEVTMANLIIDYQIESFETIFLTGYPLWYQLFFKMNGISESEIPRSKWILRLELNLDMMYKFNITSKDICDKLEQESLKCVYSPIMNINNTPTGYIDLYPVELIISQNEDLSKKKLSKDTVSLFYINNTVLPTFEKYRISGVPNIKSLVPVKVPSLGVLLDEIPLNILLNNDQWIGYVAVRIDRYYVAQKGVPVTKFIKLILALGVPSEDIKNSEEFVKIPGLENISELMYYDLIVKMPKGYSVILAGSKLSLREYIKIIYKNERDQAKEYQKEQTKKRRSVSREEAMRIPLYKPDSELEKAMNFIYADADGTNLPALYSRIDINSDYTISNDMHEIFKIFGIEITRAFIIKELIMLVTLSDTYIDPRHVLLIADYMTSIGNITQLDIDGINKYHIGTLGAAAYREPIKYLSSAALYGKKDPLTNISASIVMGQRIKAGTGIIPEPIEDKILKAKLLSQKKKIIETRLDATGTEDLISLLENGDYLEQINDSMPAESPLKLEVIPETEETPEEYLIDEDAYQFPELISDEYLEVVENLRDEPIYCESADNLIETEHAVQAISHEVSTTTIPKTVIELPTRTTTRAEYIQEVPQIEIESENPAELEDIFASL